MDSATIEACLGRWAETAGGSATLINHSENHTFRIDAHRGATILRVHRPGYHSARAIDSELQWLEALRRDTDLPVPQPLPGRDGRSLQTLDVHGDAPRHAVLFALERGAEPQPGDDLGDLFETLGRFAATAHRHAATFLPPAGFTRQVWTAGAILDGTGAWGDWRVAPNVSGSVGETLERLALRLHADLADYGMGPDCFGLIHADMRLANLLVDGDHVTLIDFDDCGFCWFMYDFAAAISFFEDSHQVPALKRRWLAGYLLIRSLSETDIAMIDAMVLLRRMALLAFIGSHGETELAQQHAGAFARVTAEMAEAYLRPLR